MTTGISIPLAVTGAGKGADEIAKIETAVKKVSAAQDHAAQSAKRMGDAQAHAAKQGHGGHMSRQERQQAKFAAGAIGMGGAAGELLHGAHAFGGKAGLAIGGIAAAGALIFEGINHFDERMAKVIEGAHEIHKKLEEAGKVLGQAGLGNISAEGHGIQRSLTAGLSMDQIKDAKRKGISADSLAEMGVGGVGAAFAARRFGVSGDAAAAEIARRGGIKGGGDDYDQAASVAGAIQHRRISADEVDRARGAGKYQSEMDRVVDIQGRGANAGIDAVTSGSAATAASENLNAISAPEQAALSAAFKSAMDESATMHRVADSQNKLVAWLQDHFDVTLKGSAKSRANQYDVDTAAKFNLATSHAAPHEAAAESGAHH